jgi:two-component system response regulator RstA
MSDDISALYVEDDVRLAKFTIAYLADHEVSVMHVGDGEAAIAESARRRFDVIVLDVMLPGQSGLAVCKAIRVRSDVPIIMVTARVEEADRVVGLEVGADDYLVKPFSPRELLARMRALVRRHRGELGPKPRELRVGALVVETAKRSATLGGVVLTLTSAEFDLLAALAERPGRVLARDQLLRLVHGTDSEAFDRAVDVQISRLRQKLSAHAGGASMIRTVRGAGYLLADETT